MNGHMFAKELICGKEYCSTCGKDESDAHNRRIARWWPKVMSMEKVGYLVVTIPDVARDSFMDTSLLRRFKIYIKRKLQRMGFKKGLIAYHWFGDCIPCEGEGCPECKFTGAGTTFEPHLNILIESGFMKGWVFDSFINEIKTDSLIWIEENTGVACNGKKNCYYNYCSTDAQKVHRMKYCLRSTFRLYNKELADLLKGFKNRTTWGKFDSCKHESKFNPVIAIEKGKCPCCKEKGVTTGLIWKEKLRRSAFLLSRKIILGSGYYQLIPDD
jgi:hypothetical protein